MLKDMDNLLRMEKISKSFPGVKALDSVHFELKRGEVHAIAGENGAGRVCQRLLRHLQEGRQLLERGRQ